DSMALDSMEQLEDADVEYELVIDESYRSPKCTDFPIASNVELVCTGLLDTVTPEPVDSTDPMDTEPMDLSQHDPPPPPLLYGTKFPKLTSQLNDSLLHDHTYGSLD